MFNFRLGIYNRESVVKKKESKYFIYVKKNELFLGVLDNRENVQKDNEIGLKEGRIEN